MRLQTLLILVLLPAAFGVAGCGTDVIGPDGSQTRLFGQVIDANSDLPVIALGLGVGYEHIAANPEVLQPAQTSGAVVQPPYPNPTVGGSVTIKVDVFEEVLAGATVEIAGISESYPGTFFTLYEGDMPGGDYTYSWNTRDAIGSYVPNGVYFVQVTGPVPGQGQAVLSEQVVVVNRSLLDVVAVGAFNSSTDGNGDYDITDIAVGTPFTATSESGANLGTRVLRNRVTVFTDDRGYEPYEELVSIAPRQTVRLDINLLPRKPGVPL